MAIYRDKRSLRHNLHKDAWVTLDAGGFAKRECEVLNVSLTGAKLRLAKGVSLPQKFYLTMTQDVRKTQLCRVVWTDGRLVGVEFVGALPVADDAPGIVP